MDTYRENMSPLITYVDSEVSGLENTTQNDQKDIQENKRKKAQDIIVKVKYFTREFGPNKIYTAEIRFKKPDYKNEIAIENAANKYRHLILNHYAEQDPVMIHTNPNFLDPDFWKANIFIPYGSPQENLAELQYTLSYKRMEVSTQNTIDRHLEQAQQKKLQEIQNLRGFYLQNNVDIDFPDLFQQTIHRDQLLDSIQNRNAPRFNEFSQRIPQQNTKITINLNNINDRPQQTRPSRFERRFKIQTIDELPKQTLQRQVIKQNTNQIKTKAIQKEKPQQRKQYKKLK